jgi:hypothetical protein
MPAEARTRFPSCHVDCLCGARLTVVAYMVNCGAAGVERRRWATRRLFHDYNAWPMGQLCPACHALWQNVMRAGAARL